nr:probable leucine-rich repeat receptor-like protein kinase At5g49770 [Tanacetum cinerariifolium]
MVDHGDLGRFQEIILLTVFPSSGAGALEEGVSLHSSDKYGDWHEVHPAFPSTCWVPRGSCWHRGGAGEELSRSGDRHQPTSQQSSHRSHGHHNDRHGSDRQGSQQSRGPSEGYSYPVCTTCGRRHPGECRRAAGTCFKCGQAGHLQKDC